MGLEVRGNVQRQPVIGQVHPAIGPRRSYSHIIAAALSAGGVAIAINTVVLFAASSIPLVTAHGGLLTVIKLLAGKLLVASGVAGLWQAAHLPEVRSMIFQVGFHVVIGLGMAVFYALMVEPRLGGAAWRKGLIYAVAIWLLNAFLILPAIGEGIAGSHSITMGGMLYFAMAHTIFFLVLALLYSKFIDRVSPTKV